MTREPDPPGAEREQDVLHAVLEAAHLRAVSVGVDSLHPEIREILALLDRAGLAPEVLDVRRQETAGGPGETVPAGDVSARVILFARSGAPRSPQIPPGLAARVAAGHVVLPRVPKRHLSEADMVTASGTVSDLIIEDRRR